MLLNIYMAIALAVYAVSCAVAWRCISLLTAPLTPAIGTVLPKIFLLTQALYVLPLSVRSLLELPADGGISQYFPEFEPYLPWAVLYTAAFNISLACFISLKPIVPAKPAEDTTGGMGPGGHLMTLIMAAITFAMLGLLAADLGGLTSLVLEGYRVTEHFIGRGYLAIAFEWATALAVLTYATAGLSGSSKQRLWSLALNGVLSTAFLIMARRGSLVQQVGALLLVHHFAVGRLRGWQVALILATGFFGLNLVGLLRGDSYADFASVKASLMTRSDDLAGDEQGWWASLTYTLTTGIFAVPFETLPQIIRSIGDAYVLGLGRYMLEGLSLIVPLPLWPDRPLPLSNWYVAEFYGVTALNEGRQFFFLTDSYMDFAAAGFLVAAGICALGIRMILSRSGQWERSPPFLAMLALICSSMTTLIAGGPSGFLVVTLKSFIAPLLMVYWADRLYQPRP